MSDKCIFRNVSHYVNFPAKNEFGLAPGNIMNLIKYEGPNKTWTNVPSVNELHTLSKL